LVLAAALPKLLSLDGLGVTEKNLEIVVFLFPTMNDTRWSSLMIDCRFERRLTRGENFLLKLKEEVMFWSMGDLMG
jgi:hypothetical protein